MNKLFVLLLTIVQGPFWSGTGENDATLDPSGLMNNRLRLSLSAKFNQTFSFTLGYDLSPRIQNPSLFDGHFFIRGIDPYHYRVMDLHSRIYLSKNEDVKSFGLFQNLDRALLTIKTGWANFVIGRQAIAWGSARVMNPTDVVAALTLAEFI